ncbi:PREDICTED: transcription cofactor vestigial-like protein 1 [Condylura cristata]|uniref:transcription cofactor vestigial-like protein 1 n=1 Tax=Condylura cristata TaxID=143302 RepID=UPI000642FACB|nr:PREDICTED: transcription cofactor vestigial-like protein 1 [Condylura cristata]XP_012582556.1 PREDICTED: transcription cofactor vestigial-like protein 1 [Condylura cristata]
MEEMRDTALQTQKPIKTEWNSRCVIFTYFQGDISSVVDEHFSRALGNVKSPQGASPLSPTEDVILRNDSDMPPNQWRFSSQWTKPQQEVSFESGGANCSLEAYGAAATEPFPMPLTEISSTQHGELWPFSSASPSTPEPGYPPAFTEGHLLPEPQQDENYEPLLSLLQQDRCLGLPQQSTSWEDYHAAPIAGSTGLLFNLPPSSSHYKKVYFSPDRGPATTSLASEKTQCPGSSKDMFFY